jgi:hypothetical protein
VSTPGTIDVNLEHLMHPEREEPLRVGLINLTTRVTGSPYHLIREEIFKAFHSGKYDLIICPEYAFANLDKVMEAYFVEEMRLLSLEGDCAINPGSFYHDSDSEKSSYVFHNGDIYEFKKGVGPYTDFPLWGLKSGLEICSDRGRYKLQGIDDLDLLLHPSAGLSTPRMDSVRVGGYGINNNGYKNTSCKVLFREEKGVRTVFAHNTTAREDNCNAWMTIT